MSMAGGGYLYIEMYIVQLTKIPVLAQLIYSWTYHFLIKHLKPKHTRTFCTKHFLS